MLSMSWTIRFARSPCWWMLVRFSSNSLPMSTINWRCSSFNSSPAGGISSWSSSRISLQPSEKFLTKFNGFLISWATPAVSWPSAASFSRMTIWSWALRRSPSTFSSSSFLPRSSSASFSTKFRRWASSERRRKTSRAAAISATSSRPSISTSASRSPAAIPRMRSDNWARRRTNAPTNTQAMTMAPPMETTFSPSSRFWPVAIAPSAACVASSALARAVRTMPSTSVTSPAARSRLRSSKSCCRPARASSRARRSKPALAPMPRSKSCAKPDSNSGTTAASPSPARFRSAPAALASNRSRRGSSRRASDRANALASSRVPSVAVACNSTKWRYRWNSSSEKWVWRGVGGSPRMR